MATHEGSGRDPLAVAGAAAQRTSRLRHAMIAQVLAVLLLGAVLVWQPGRASALAGGSSSGSGEEFVRVTVPPQSHPGDMLQVAVAGHRAREIEVPPGAQPGQTLMFGMPASAPAPAPVPASRAPSSALPASRAAAAHKSQEREVAEATRSAYRAAVGKASTLAEAADPAAAPAADPAAGAAPSETEVDGDDFGPLIAAIKQIIQSSTSDDPGAKAQSQDALKAAVNGIVEAKIKAARAKDAAEAAAAKKVEDENVAKKLGRLLGEQKAAEEAKVKAALAAQKAAEEAKAEAEADAKEAEEEKKELEKENAEAKEAKEETEGKEAAPQTATIGLKEVDTESTDRGSGSTHFLDRQDVDCKGYPMSGFKMQTTDNMTKISYKIQCGIGANLDVSEDKQTSVEDDGGGDLIFLDRLDVDCGSNAAISEFNLIRDGDGEEQDKDHYSYTCISSEPENPMIECENLSTQPNDGGAGGLVVEFLDRHDVRCPENKVLQQFKLTTTDGGEEGGTIHYDYRCCAVKSNEQTPEAVVDEENKIGEDVDGAEKAAKSAESAVDAEATAETAEEQAVKEDAEAVEAAKKLANEAADKAKAAEQSAEKTAEEEADAARQNMISAETKEAAEIAKEDEIVEAARAAYRKALAEATAAEASEDMAKHDVAEIEEDEDRTLSEADKAADEAESERTKAENERDAAERERFSAEDAAKRSSVAEAEAKDERDEARMERERAEKAARDAVANGVSTQSAEARIAEQISAYRDSERETLERYRDSEMEEIEKNDKELKDAIEKAQEQIRRAQDKMADRVGKRKESAKDHVRRAIRRASKDLRSEVEGVKDMVRDLRRQVDHKGSPPYAYAAPWGAPYQQPYAPAYGGALPYPPPVYGARYHNDDWEDKAIFLQRELNDMEAERGLYERRLAVTAANIGLMKNAKTHAVATAVALPHAVGVPVATTVSPPAPLGTTSVTTVATAAPYAPYAGTALPVVPAIPVGATSFWRYAADRAGGVAVPSSGGMVTESPAPSSDPATTSETVEMAQPLRNVQLAARYGGMMQSGEADAGQGWATPMGDPLATQATMLATAQGMTAAAQGSRTGDAKKKQQQVQQQQALYQAAPAGVSAQTYRLRPGMSYTIQV